MNANNEKIECKPAKMGPIKWLLSSLDTITKGGASARKVSAFYAVVIIAGPCTLAKTNEANLFWTQVLWLTFGAICLGMVTIPELITFLRSGSVDKNKPEEKTQESG